MAENGILDYQGMNQAIYRGATSNIVVDTQSMSIEIGAGNTSHTSNLHFECNHDANVASIKLNSNVTTEFSRSKKLIKYPRVALTSASYNAYESGYKVTVSGFVNTSNYPWKAFNGIDYEVGMLLSGLNYDTNGNANTTGTTASRLSSSDSTPYGEWLKLELPNKIKLDKYVFTSRNDATHWAQGPEAGQVWGSNDDSNWTHLHTFTNSGFTGESQTASFDVQTDNYYKYYAFIVTKTFAAGSDYYLCLPELKYYGVPEYDPEAYGTDVVVKSEANVPNTDWLEVYYEGKNYTNGVVQDETGNNRNGTLDGVTYDSVSESFTFVSGNKITAGPMTPFPSGTNYTASMWFKVSEIVASQKILFHFGHGDTGESFGLNIQNGNIGLFLWGLQTNFTADNLYTANEWVHAVGTINGLTTEVYVNGHLRLSSAQGSTITIPTNPYLSLGIHFNGEQSSFFTSGFFTGSIANFRLFNRALTSDEIYQLYAYQKEYFGHGDLSMTLKAGRLGIGTSEPRAMLDVRGDFYAPGSVVQIQTNVFTAVTSTSDTTWKDISSNFGVTITPKFANSNFLIQAMIHQGGDNSGDGRFTFYRIGRYVNDTLTEVGNGDTGNTSGIGTVCTAAHNWGAGGALAAQTYDLAIANVNIVYVDQPNTTSPITYRIRWNSNPGGNGTRTAYINRVDNHNDGYRPNTISTLVITEIAQ